MSEDSGAPNARKLLSLWQMPAVRGIVAAALCLVAHWAMMILSLSDDPRPVLFVPCGVVLALAFSTTTTWQFVATLTGATLAAMGWWGFTQHDWNLGAVHGLVMLTEMVTATAIARRISGGDSHARSFRGMVSFVAVSAPAACLAGGVVLYICLQYGLQLPPSRVPGAVTGRVLSDFIGAIVVGPCMMRALLFAPIESWGWRFVEGIAIVIAAGLVSIGVFSIGAGGEGIALALAFAPLPIILYSAVRIGQANASLCIAITAAVLLVFTRSGRGPLNALISDPTQLVVAIQSYLAILSASAMLLAAAMLSARRTAKALRESEANYRTFISQSSEGVWRVELPVPVSTSLPAEQQIAEFFRSGRLVECNDAMARMYGAADASSLAGIPLCQMLVPEDPRNAEYLRNFIGNGYHLENAISYERGLDGSEVVFANSLMGIIEHGHIVAAWGTQRDITSTKRAQAALEQSERRWRALVELTPHITIQGYDVNGRVTFWNPASEHVFGYTARQAMGKTLDQLIFDKPTAERFQQLIRAMAADGQPWGPGKLEFTHADGRSRVVMSSIFPAPGPDGSLQFVCMDYDVTEQVASERERRQLEEQLHRTQKLESLGVMAGGVAHDFNNLLVGVLGNAALALSQLPGEHPAAATLRNVQDAARRAAELTRQLLAYAGKAGGTRRAVNVADVLTPMLPLMRSMISQSIDLTTQREDDLPCVMADPTQIEQVLLNLVTNAAEACEDRNMPRISIRIHAQTIVSEQLSTDFIPGNLSDGEYVCIDVEDNGKGMTTQVRNRLFDPFFSTKFTGRGLGLAVVLGIVRGTGGGISVSSIPGTGTFFRVILPATRALELIKDAAIVEPKSHASHQSVQALIVDDEPMVAQVLALSLKSLGWNVDTAGSGEEALALLTPDSPHTLAIIDVTMPVMSGIELATRIRALRPGMTLLLSSGYAAESLTELPHGLVDGFVAKPFTPDSLLDALMQALSTRSQNAAAMN
ncbi:MAG: PAS domain S-box protein [Planctomycetota bacterium]|nr:PAS domain S-box protein [Planctomycetota bacterium]